MDWSAPPNRVQRDYKGNYTLDGYYIHLDYNDKFWKYSDGKLVKEHERWIPQKADRPPNESYRYKGEYYLNKLHIIFNPLTDRWIDSEDQSYVDAQYGALDLKTPKN